MMIYILFLIVVCIIIYIIMRVLSKGHYCDHGVVTLANPNNNIQIIQEYDDNDK